MFENRKKVLILQDCERSELRLHFERTKVHQKCLIMSILSVFEKLMNAVKEGYQTKIGENAKIHMRHFE